MDRLKLEPSHETPEILIDPQSREIKIIGNSFPPDPSKFYFEVIKWLDIFYSNLTSPSKVIVELNYFDRSSYGYLMKIIRKMEDISKKGSRISLIWYYQKDDEDIKELGKSLKEILSLNFKVEEKADLIKENEA